MTMDFHKFILRRYDKSPVARLLYRFCSTREQKREEHSLVKILGENLITVRERLTMFTLRGVKDKQYTLDVISHTFNNTHQLETKYFFEHKMGILTFIRLLIMMKSFAHMSEYKFLGRVFRELITREELHQFRLVMKHYIAMGVRRDSLQ